MRCLSYAQPGYRVRNANSASVNEADDVLKLERLEEAYGDDRPAIANMLGLARDTEQRYIHALHEGIAQNDIRAVARAAHSIKGSASNIGAALVSRAAADIEDRARLERWDGIAGGADALDRAYADLRTRIAKYIARAM
jgi:HPt (histidine-containing phosphotransfer) domain-containing protein